MALAAVVLILFQLWLNRPDDKAKPKVKLLIPDICILILSVILMINMCPLLISSINFQTIYVYGKIASALLLYLLGRICHKRIEECSVALLFSSYIVIYSNLIYRIINYGTKIFNVYEPNGDLYYDDTDMAFSIIMAMIFIAILAKNTLIKFITMFIICPFLVFHSDAGVQKLMLIIIFIILIIYMMERAVKKRRYTDYILPATVFVFMLFMFFMILPVFIGKTDNQFIELMNKININTDNLESRYIKWINMCREIKFTNLKELLIGRGIQNGIQSGNSYIEILYSTGLIGLLSSVVFIISISGKAMKIVDRKTYYITIMLTILFMGSCFNKNGMEFTQMSWFVMMYLGMGAAVSGEKYELINEEEV